MKTPIRYAGGKSKAYSIITEHLPSSVDTIVSPFLGGGSLEVKWATERNIRVIGYDVFDILVNFWQVLLSNPQGLASELEKLSPTKEEYEKVKEILMTWDKTQNMLSGWHTDYYKRNPVELDNLIGSAYYFFNHNLSYGPMYLGWISKIYQNRKKWVQMVEGIRSFSAPKLSVDCKPFDQSILMHENDFLYLDPPYYLEKDSDNKMFKGIYPNANIDVHHSGFDHEKLRDLLHNHKGDFILSYNNCETIREYYSDFEQVFPEWHYSFALGEKRIGKNKASVGNKPKESHEILILKKSKKVFGNDKFFS
jgi:DNA adenine methylase